MDRERERDLSINYKYNHTHFKKPHTHTHEICTTIKKTYLRTEDTWLLQLNKLYYESATIAFVFINLTSRMMAAGMRIEIKDSIRGSTWMTCGLL